MRGFSLLVMIVAALLAPAVAEAADPYVDAIAPGNQVEVLNGGDLTGPPDGRFATVRGRFGQNPSTRPYRYLSILVGPRTVGFDSMRAAALAR